MGMLGGVLKSVGSFIKPLAQSALRAVAPAATNLLKNIVGTGFDALKSIAPKALQTILPGPIGALASKLLGPLVGKGIDALKGLTQGGIEKLVQGLVNKVAPQTTKDGVTTTTPAFPERVSPQTTSTTNAAVAGAVAGAGGAVSAGASSAGEALQNAASGSSGMPDPSKFGDLTKPENMAKFQNAQFAYQQTMNRLNEMFQLMSNVEKSRSDTAKQISGNIC